MQTLQIYKSNEQLISGSIFVLSALTRVNLFTLQNCSEVNRYFRFLSIFKKVEAESISLIENTLAFTYRWTSSICYPKRPNFREKIVKITRHWKAAKFHLIYYYASQYELCMH